MFDRTVFKTKPSKPLIQLSANKTLFALLFITGSWLICSEIWAYPRGLMMKTAPSQKALHGNKVPSDTMVQGTSKKFHLKYPASDWLMPFQRQSKDLEKAQPVLLQYLEAADDVCDSKAGILCPVLQQGKSGSSLSSMACWDQQWVHHSARSADTKSPGAALVIGHPTAMEGWRKEPRAARAPRLHWPFPQRQKGPEVQPQWDCYRRETEQLPSARAAALPEVKKESFFRFLENQKTWISASLKRNPYLHAYVQIMYLYG